MLVMSASRSKKTRAKKKRRVRKTRNQVGTGESYMGAPLFAPPETIVTLCYQDNAVARNNVGVQYLIFRLRTSVNDPDPLLGSGGVSGFVEWGALYRKWIILSVDIDWKVDNLESFPMTIIFAPTTVDIFASVVSRNDALDIAELPNSQSKQVSASSGMDRSFIRSRVNLSAFSGDPTYYRSSGLFNGVGAANPTLMYYFNFVIVTNVNLVSGIFSNLRIRYKVRFYERNYVFDRNFLRVHGFSRYDAMGCERSPYEIAAMDAMRLSLND